jgi:hypothetical protein
VILSYILVTKHNHTLGLSFVFAFRPTSLLACTRVSVFLYGIYVFMYEGRLKSSWTHLITPSWNLVEVR